MIKTTKKRRILIYRLGSLGDTIVALPSLRLIERSFPNTERWMLTNFRVNDKAAPMAQVLDGTDLVHGYIEYPLGLRDPSELLRLRNGIRQLRPEALVYLAEPRGTMKILRDAAFFYACGIRRMIGVPYRKEDQQPLKLADEQYEYEGARLLRCLRSLGQISLGDIDAYDLKLNDGEYAAAKELLGPLKEGDLLFAASIGCKISVNDWGDAKWLNLIQELSESFPSARLVLIGSESERERSELLLRHWKGAGLNACGRLTVRESAAILEKANLYIGHDSGPMHLAAAVGTPCVAIFSSRNLPGEWFPYGKDHKILYTAISCQGCKLSICDVQGKACIQSIRVDSVMAKIDQILSKHNDLPNARDLHLPYEN